MSVEWLTDFFAGENQIDLAKVMAGEFGQVYMDMMEPLIKGASVNRWPIILPFSDGRLRFYAATQGERKLLELRRVLGASLGSADTDGDLLIIKEASNFSEEVLLNQAPTGLLRINMLDSSINDLEAKKRIFRVLKIVLTLYGQRPDLTDQIRRPVGRILREFFTACQVSDGKEAERLFQEIKASSRLSQRNLLFLHFQALASAHQWEAILDHGQLASCLKGRIPMQVRYLMLKALANRLQPLLQNGFAGADLDQVRQQCQVLVPLFGESPYFSELQNVKDDWKAWAIGATLYGRADINQHLYPDIESSWLADLFAWTGIEEQDRERERQDELKEEERSQFDLQRAKELLKATLEASGEELRETLIALSAMPVEVVEQIKMVPNLHQYWLTLQQQNLSPNYGWNQLVTDICEQEGRVDELLQLAMNEYQSWPVSSFDANSILSTLEIDGSGETGDVLRDVMPLMIDWLNSRNITCEDLFWVKLLELLALDDIANQQDVQLAYSLLEGFLSKSYSVDNYKNALQAVEILLEKVTSTKSYDAVMELMDLLLDAPCPSLEALQSLWRAIQSFAIIKWHRLSPLLRRLTLFSAREILGEGADNAFPEVLVQESNEVESEDQFPDLSGKELAIYSLTEGAARRAKDMLESLFGGLLIYLNHDHVATSALENLAKKAEYFIFAAKSAKHQAFYAVKKIRTDIIYPEGKGAMSIVRAFVATVNETEL